MTRYGFLIDQDTCIGCHACTVACKSEHDVGLGVNRTWVKYVETGSYPEVARKFSVMRCNHCENAPCVEICPTKALFVRDNGIVDFDTSRCIGCKGCMNACPYDALYIDPDEHTAQKCNFCAHRVETGLQPSCVVVCPTQSIVAGDLDEPTSRIATLIARHDVAVRTPEQGTRPKLFYKGADQASLDPTRTAIAPDGMIWADTTADHPTVPLVATPPAGNGNGDHPSRKSPSSSVDPDVVARTVYTTQHPAPWGSKVTAYLVTKAIAAGALGVAALLVLLGHASDQAAVGIVPPVIAGAFLVLTGVLLVADLKQPGRFHYLFTKPNWSSWLVKGALILALYAVVAAAWFVAGVADAGSVIEWLAIPAVLLGAATAGYTAMLFGQCEGRDLWQTPLLLPVLLAQAASAGAAALLVADGFMDVPEPDALRWTLLGGVCALALLIGTEALASGSRHVELATKALMRGSAASRFWTSVALGIVVPVVLLILALTGTAPVALSFAAAISAVVGLVAYEDAFVRAGQSVPLS